MGCTRIAEERGRDNCYKEHGTKGIGGNGTGKCFPWWLMSVIVSRDSAFIINLPIA